MQKTFKYWGPVDAGCRGGVRECFPYSLICHNEPQQLSIISCTLQWDWEQNAPRAERGQRWG